MTPQQTELLTRLRATCDHHGQTALGIEIEAGPRVFDVRCHHDRRTIEHWAGTADQIVAALSKWIVRRSSIDSRGLGGRSAE